MATTTLRDLFGGGFVAKTGGVVDGGEAQVFRIKRVRHGKPLKSKKKAKTSVPPPVVSDSPFMAATQGLRGGVPSSRRRIIDKCGKSLKAFCLEYLGHHFPSGFCEVHEDIFAACDAPSPPTGKRVARAAPRKFGKTTIISLALALQKLAYREKSYVLLVGETATTAEANLGTLTAEVENNERLLADFPHLRPAKDTKGQPVKWTDKQIVFSTFQTVRAVGMGAKSRGIKYRQHRPDLAICDDLESTESADTFLKRLRHKRWWGGTFLGLGATGWDIYYIGNLIHNDCLLASLLKAKDYDSLLWRAINILKDEEIYPVGNTKNDGSAVWPEVWGLVALKALKDSPEVGEFNFAREMMNDPKTKEEQQFEVSEFTYYDHTPEHEATYVRKLTYVDPAGGELPGQMKKGRRDYCAIVTGGVSKEDNWIEIFDVVLTRLTPDKQIEKILDVYQRVRAPVQVEDNMFKHLYASSMSKAAGARQLYPPISTRTMTGQNNKIQRILGVQPLIMHRETRKVRFAKHLIEKVPEYFSQFDEFPGEYDDGPDATEGVVKGLERPAAPKVLGTPSLQSVSKWRNM